MSVIFIDGCDHYLDRAHIEKKWGLGGGTPYFQPGKGLGGGGAINVFGGGANLVKYFEYTSKLTFGFWAKFPSRTEPAYFQNIFGASTSTNTNYVTGISIGYSQDLAIQLSKVGTNTGIGNYNNFTTIDLDVWHFWEVQILQVFAGRYTYRIQVDEQPMYLQTVNISPFAGIGSGEYSKVELGTHVIQFSIAPSSKLEYYDDIYVLDATGANSDFLGITYIDTCYPGSEGDANDFESNDGGSKTDALKDGTYEDRYLELQGAGDQNFLMRTNGWDLDFLAVQTNVLARKDDSKTRVMRATVRRRGVELTGSDFGLALDWTNKRDIFQTEPKYENPWNKYAFRDTKFGFEED